LTKIHSASSGQRTKFEGIEHTLYAICAAHHIG